MRVGIKVLDGGRVPVYAKPGDAGADIFCPRDVEVFPGCIDVIALGICLEIPDGFEAQIRGRSSLNRKGMWVAKGTIDSGYRGEVSVVMRNMSGMIHTLREGDRIAQLVIAPVVRADFCVCEELSESERGSGGFGSTGA